MKTLSLFSAAAASLLVIALEVAPAHAIPRTFVSSTGGGVACTRAAPCGTFQAAHDATDPGGEINCVDSGTYGGSTTITKSITIDCAGAAGNVVVDASVGFLINTAGIVVRIRNLTIASGTAGSAGISFTNGSALMVENCMISGFRTSLPDSTFGRGIMFAPASGVTARLYVTDSVLNNNNVPGITGVGIEAAADPSASAFVTLNRVRLENNRSGFIAAAGGLVAAQIRNSVISNNIVDGIFAGTAGNGIASVTLDRSSSILNAFGLRTVGSGAFILVGKSTVMSNNTGLDASGGGFLLSYQDNQLTGNVTDGNPTGVLNER